MARIDQSQLQGFLGGMDYPASRQDVVNHARAMGADADIVDTLRNLPYDRFSSADDISEAVNRMD